MAMVPIVPTMWLGSWEELDFGFWIFIYRSNLLLPCSCTDSHVDATQSFGFVVSSAESVTVSNQLQSTIPT